MIDPVVPMQPVPRDEPFDDPDWLYQIKWDGVRILAYLEDGDVQYVNRKLRPRTANYADMLMVKEQVKARSVVLDGEMIGLGADGKPSFSAILKRDLVKGADKIRKAIARQPVFYMVWDILYLDGTWLLDEPLWRRQERLAAVLEPSERVQLLDNYDSGTELFRVMEAQGMEGIICKERQGRYVLGEYHATWKKVKNYRHQQVVVGGAILKSGLVNSLLLGVYQDGVLLFIGKAATGLSAADIQALTQFATQLPPQPSPFANLPKLSVPAYEQTVWFPPQLVVEVRFLEWTSDLTLRAPIVLGFRQVDPKSCIL